MLQVERLELVLREVRDLDVMAEHPLAVLEVEHAGEHLQQRRLPCTVRTHERDLVASVEREVEVLVDDVVAVRLAHVLERDHELAGTRRLRELEPDGLALLGDLDELGLDLLDAPDPVLRGDRLRVLVAEAVDEHLHVGDLFELRLPLDPQLLERQLLLLQVRRVVAGVNRDLALVDVGDVVDEPLHERAVVADDQDRSVVGAQERLEPSHRLQVQVVGGLVEQQHVGLAQQQLRQREPHEPPSRELARVPLQVALPEPEPHQHGPRLGLERVAAQVLEPLPQPSVLGEQPVLLRALGGLGEVLLEQADAVLEGGDVLGGGQRLREHGPPRHLDGFLLEVADHDVLGEHDRTRVGRSVVRR